MIMTKPLISRFILSIIAIIYLTSCGPFKPAPSDARKVSPNVKERVRQNIEKGKGFRL